MTTQERYGLPEELSLTVKVDAEIAQTVYYECNPVWDGSEPDGSGRTTAVNHIMRQLKDQIGNVSKLPKGVEERARVLYPEPEFTFDSAIPLGWEKALYEESGPYEYDFRGTGSFVWVYKHAYDDEGNRISGSSTWGSPGPITPEALNVCIENSFNEMSDSLRGRACGPHPHFKALSNWQYHGWFSSAIPDMKEAWDKSMGHGFLKVINASRDTPTATMNVHVNRGE